MIHPFRCTSSTVMRKIDHGHARGRERGGVALQAQGACLGSDAPKGLRHERGCVPMTSRPRISAVEGKTRADAPALLLRVRLEAELLAAHTGLEHETALAGREDSHSIL